MSNTDLFVLNDSVKETQKISKIFYQILCNCKLLDHAYRLKEEIPTRLVIVMSERNTVVRMVTRYSQET